MGDDDAHTCKKMCFTSFSLRLNPDVCTRKRERERKSLVGPGTPDRIHIRVAINDINAYTSGQTPSLLYISYKMVARAV